MKFYKERLKTSCKKEEVPTTTFKKNRGSVIMNRDEPRESNRIMNKDDPRKFYRSKSRSKSQPRKKSQTFYR